MTDAKSNLKTVEVKLYPSRKQIATLESWMRICCWIYNRCLEQRSKAYKRRAESSNFHRQCKLLTYWRGRMSRIRGVPVAFCRDPIRRLDKAFVAFFRHVKVGENPGYPRFKPSHRWRSLEHLQAGRYIRGQFIHVPKLGRIRFRSGGQEVASEQKLLRIIQRPSGWCAQVLFELPTTTVTATAEAKAIVGIDLGLEHFAALSTGEFVANPRCLRQSQRALQHAQRNLSRKSKGSQNRRKAIRVIARIHERVKFQRKSFCHAVSRRIVNEFNIICHEDLNIKGLARTKLAKSIHDAGWRIFLKQIAFKAAWAGKQVVAVNSAGTSQKCPQCGQVKKKSLSDRVHQCSNCGLRCQRDFASSLVIRDRGAKSIASSLVEGSPAASSLCSMQGGPAKQVAIDQH